MSEQTEIEAVEQEDLPPIVEPAPEVASLFRWSEYVHVGVGAKECEHGEDGRCSDPSHFHAWIHLPNQFQNEQIQIKARAARARMQRALKDPQTDAFAILDADVEDLREKATDEQITTALVEITAMEDRLEAMRELEFAEDAPWEHRSQDVERIRELQAMSDEDRDQDELDMLLRESERYGEEVAAKLVEIQVPKRAALMALGKDGLMERWREVRIGNEGSGAFTSAYQRYEWYSCTMKPCAQGRPQERMFKEISGLDAAAPEVIDALQSRYATLEMAHQRVLSGNS